MFLSSALLTCWAVGETAVPAVIGATVDEAVGPSDLPRLVLWLIVLGLCFLVLSYGFRTGSRIGWFARTRQKHRLRGDIAAATLDPARRSTGRLPGEIASLASSDTDAATGVLQQAAMGAASVLGLLVCAGYLLWADVWVGLAVLAATPLSMAALRLATPLLSRTSHRQQEGIAAAGASAADVMQGVEVLRGIGGESRAARWYRRHSQDAAEAGVAAAGASGRLEGAQVFLSGVVLLIAAGLGSWRAVDGAMTVGTLVGVLGVTTFLAGPVGMVVAFIEGYTRSVASARRIAAYLGDDGKAADGVDAGHTAAPSPAPSPGASVTLALADGTTVDCAAGRFTALVCGDATVHRAVGEALGHGDRSGTVLLDGVDIRSLDPRSLPGVVRIAPHTAHLFAGTLMENIAGPGGVDLPGALLHASGCDELIELFADGAGHRVEGAGTNLSGGQQQRVVLARALAGPPDGGPLTRFLVDPTTAVDSVTEARIAEGLRELRAGSRQGTLVVVTTSPTLLAVADEVVLVGSGGGDVPHRATHAELLAVDSYRAVVSR
ncbi:MAG: ABC transporter transmembrane domain-containing protein [Corynebacterium sp.]